MRMLLKTDAHYNLCKDVHFRRYTKHFFQAFGTTSDLGASLKPLIDQIDVESIQFRTKNINQINQTVRGSRNPHWSFGHNSLPQRRRANRIGGNGFKTSSRTSRTSGKSQNLLYRRRQLIEVIRVKLWNSLLFYVFWHRLPYFNRLLLMVCQHGGRIGWTRQLASA